MSGENTDVYKPHGGDEIVVKNGGEINLKDGGEINFGTGTDATLTFDGTNLVLTLTAGELVITSLPTGDPGVVGALWANSAVVTVSSG